MYIVHKFDISFKSNDHPKLVVQEMGDEGDFHQGILDILYATEVLDEKDFLDDFF